MKRKRLEMLKQNRLDLDVKYLNFAVSRSIAMNDIQKNALFWTKNR